MKAQFKQGSNLYDYSIEFANRKDLDFEILPNLKIVIKTPPNSKLADIETFLTNEWPNIENQLNQMRESGEPRLVKEYVSGESLYFLGRLYKLQIESAAYDSVKLGHEILHVNTTHDPMDGASNKELIDAWYAKQRILIYNEQLRKAFNLFDYDQIPKLSKRSIERSWSSLTNDNEIHFNPHLIEAPREVIHYICVHELCHKISPKHDKLFYTELEKHIPKWQYLKDSLEIRHGQGFTDSKRR